MAKIRVGVQLHPQHTTYASYADAVQKLDQMGVDTLWNWDHFFPLYGEPNGPHFEAWTLLTAMATLTSHAEIGCLVICNSYRNPSLLSQMAKTLDHVSNGRLILGIGAGWYERDYNEYGYEFGTAGSRLRDLGKALPIIQQRWKQDLPLPVRNPIPILIGGGGEKVTLKLTAQYADIWNGFGPIETYQHKNNVLNNWCDSVGRPRDEIERSVSIGADDLTNLDAFVTAGATHIIMRFSEPWNYDAVEKLIAWRNGQ
ncbi:LLM class F420-dependent oxidoreductase [Chloroflexi bacterium TSY]|nr:LLM class F420-dependent oxidoreductase [Chloroflexi bacterium TSY]